MISAKVALMSTGALSAAVALGMTAPAMSAFLWSEVPRVYRALLVWLTPPYLYLVINGIIISIAASSRFQKADALEEGADAVPTAAPAVKSYAEGRPEEPPPPVVFEIGGGTEEEEEGGQCGYGAGEGGAEGRVVSVSEGAAEEEEEFVRSRSSWTPEMRPPTAEKPLVSMRFGSRRGVKASPEGSASGVAMPRKYETLEITWKTITDGRPLPLPRHLKKSDTWGADGGGQAARYEAATPPMRKAETFTERRSPSPSPGLLLRREASPGQDELNRRVEAFIRKFNEEIRLQRQESFKNYMDMINRCTR